MTHTKGPWKAEEIGGDSGAFRIGENGALLEASEENVSLIAAAPELLEACRQALYILGDLTDIDGATVDYDSNDKFAQEAMRIYETVLPEAIAKAEGKAVSEGGE